MGRGRAKAKQTKVARRLKYYSPDTDLTALQRELASGQDPYGLPRTHSASEGDGDDEGYDEPDDEADWSVGPR